MERVGNSGTGNRRFGRDRGEMGEQGSISSKDRLSTTISLLSPCVSLERLILHFQQEVYRRANDIVRLALATEYKRGALKRTDMIEKSGCFNSYAFLIHLLDLKEVDKTFKLRRVSRPKAYNSLPFLLSPPHLLSLSVLGKDHARAFPLILQRACKILKRSFGYELVELRARGTENEQLKAQQASASAANERAVQEEEEAEGSKKSKDAAAKKRKRGGADGEEEEAGDKSVGGKPKGE